MMFKKYQMKSYNYRLVAILIITSLYGLVIINSADSSYTMKQCFGLALALVVMLFLSFVDYNWILQYYWILYPGIIVLLALVKVAGKTVKGAKRWVMIGPIQIQPSELTKLVMILVCAKLICMYKEQLDSWKFLAILWAILMVPLALVLAEPDLSQTILLTVILFTVIFCAGVSYKKIGIVLLIVVPVFLSLFIYIQNPNQKLLAHYQWLRVMAFVNPDEYDDSVYQQKYSEQAIGSGQLVGKGLNNDDPTSLLNADYIPEAQTDFIFAALAEQLGFVGCMFALLLLGAIIFECLYTAYKAKDYAGRLICCGIAAYIGFQTAINIGVVTRILPNTGLPLPFFSYGLSSLLSLFMAMGIVLNVSLQRKSDKNDDILPKQFSGIQYFGE